MIYVNRLSSIYNLSNYGWLAMDIKTLCLGVLSLGDASGYDIKKVFEDAFSHFYVAGFGSIYPALAELSREGYATCIEQEQEQEKRPAKKVYHLTDAGLEAFRAALAQTYPSHRVRSDFMVLLMFSHLLTPEQMEETLMQRVDDIDKELKHLECLAPDGKSLPAGASFAAGLGHALLQTAREYISQNKEPFLRQLFNEDEKT